MNLNDLQEQIKIDLSIKHDELNFESIRTPDIHWTYNKILMSEKLTLKKLEREWDDLYLKRWEYYRHKSDPEVYEKKPLLKKIIDTDVKLYLAADEELQKLRTQIESKNELIDFLKRTMDQISARQWNIKNALDFLKYLGNEK